MNTQIRGSGVAAASKPQGLRNPGRPLEGILSVQVITTTALRLVERAGLKHLTMSTLAEELGVTKSSLYNHVTSKDHILQLMHHQLIVEVNAYRFDARSWRDAMQARAWAYCTILVRHPAMIPVMGLRPASPTERAARKHRIWGPLLSAAAWPEHFSEAAVLVLDSFTFAAALDRITASTYSESCHSEPQRTASMTAKTSANTTYSEPDNVFQAGLDGLLSGLGILMDRSRTKSAAAPERTNGRNINNG